MAQGYMTEANYTTGYSTAPGFRGIKAPHRIATRYLTEDLAYTMVFWTDLAARLGVATPVMDATIQIASCGSGPATPPPRHLQHRRAQAPATGRARSSCSTSRRTGIE